MIYFILAIEYVWIALRTIIANKNTPDQIVLWVVNCYLVKGCTDIFDNLHVKVQARRMQAVL